jgi:NTE family protein
MTDERSPVETALVLSAGAPTAPLIAGVLHTFYKEGARFPIIYASGGGALVALMLVAPRVTDPAGIGPSDDGIAARLAALEKIPRALGVADEIYRYLPLGYKAFFKLGPYTAPFRAWSQNFKLEDPAVTAGRGPDRLSSRLNTWLATKVFAPAAGESAAAQKWRRLYNDWVDLATSLMTPQLLTLGNRGLCAPFPFLEELVDFELLRRWTGKFYMPAYDLTADPGERLVQFTNDPKKRDERKLNGPAEFRACLAGAFIYPPVGIDGHLYTEGAFHDPQNVAGWIDELEHRKIDNVLILDTLGTLEMERILLRAPRGLRDAYGLSIMTAAVAAARAQRKIFESKLTLLREERSKKKIRQPTDLYRRFEWKIPEQLWPTITEWNYNNLWALFEHGQKLGAEYLNKPTDRFAHYMGGARRRIPANRAFLCHGGFRGRSREYVSDGTVAHATTHSRAGRKGPHPKY